MMSNTINSCIAIVTGMTQSGTTYLSSVINSHPQIFSGVELGLLLEYIDSKNIKPQYRQAFLNFQEIHRERRQLNYDLQFGLSSKINHIVKTCNVVEAYNSINELKGLSYPSESLIRHLLLTTQYFIDKCPQYINYIESIFNSIKEIQTLPWFISAKSFEGIYTSHIIRRGHPVPKFLEEVEQFMDGLKFILKHNLQNCFVFSYEDYMSNITIYNQAILDILQKFHPNLASCILSHDKFKQKIGDTNYNYSKWKHTERNLDEKFQQFNDLKTEYNSLIRQFPSPVSQNNSSMLA